MNVEHETDKPNSVVAKLKGPEWLDPFTETLVRMGLIAYVSLRYPLRTSIIGTYRPARTIIAITEPRRNAWQK